MSWEAISAIATVFTGLVVVVTAFVGIDQLRQFRGQRRDAAAVELVRSLQDDSFLRAYRLVFSLPEQVIATDLRAKGAEYEEAATLLGFRFEMLGVLVYRGAIPFDIAEDLGGGLVVGAWRRIKNTALEAREGLEWPSYFEWFQWLAEQFEKRERLQQTPAHIRLKDRHSSARV